MKLRDFSNIIWIFITSITITVIVPGLISTINKTFYKESFHSRLPEMQLQKLKEYRDVSDKLSKEISKVNQKLSQEATSDSLMNGFKIDALVKARKVLEDEKARLKTPLTLIPFYLNPQMLLWLGIYSALMLIIYLLTKSESIKPRLTRKVITFSLLLYIFYEWPLWMRNFVLNTKGRTVFAYPNFDIDKLSFFYQEFIIYTFCLLIAILIYVNVEINYKRDNRPIPKNDINSFLLVSSYYTSSYRDWFINSIILALGFLSFTSFFWKLVFDYGDQRYLLSAVNAHVIWAISWISISLHLFRYMRTYEKFKRELLRSNPDDKTLKIILEHQPANNMTIVISGIVSLTTFVSPLLKMLITK